MYKQDLALNNQERLICYKTNQPTNQPTFSHYATEASLCLTDYY